MKMMTKRMAMAGLLAVLAVGGARADMVLIDFGPLAGRHSVGAADSGGNWWNHVTGATDVIGDLVDADNQSSGIGLTMSGWDGMNTWNAGLTPDPALNGGTFAYTAVTDDGAYFTAAQAPSILLSGLDPSLTYDFTFYGARRDAVRYTTYDINGNAVELQTGFSPGWNDDTVVMLSGMTPDGNGDLQIDFIGYTGSGETGSRTFGYLNAMQIDVVPEPAAFSFMLIGAMALRLMRRRR